MNQLTKSEIYHLIIGFIAAAVWLFGKQWELPIEAISYAQTLTIAVCAHALGTAKSDTPLPPDTNSVSLSQPKQGDANV
jgi:multisubunit Na+/H+ antiporter MnhG subunit